VTQELVTRRTNDEAEKSMSGTVNMVVDLYHGAEDYEKQIIFLAEQLQAVFSNDRHITGRINIAITSQDGAPDGADRSKDTLEKLRKSVEGVNQQIQRTQSTPNPFQFFANIMGSQKSSEEGSKVCAILDTASADNWIAASIVERFELQNLVQPAVEVPCTGAGGNLFYSKGMISVLWTRDSAKSWETEFLIQENAPFDMLLGRKFIVEEGMLVLADPVLVHDNVSRLAPLSKGM
jgi:hypothetical protein